MPVFVVTHRPHVAVVKGDTTFEFVTDGPDAALARARAAAGGRNILVMGGANLLSQYLAAGVVDELTITIAPVLLGSGKRLFDGTLRSDLRGQPTPACCRRRERQSRSGRRMSRRRSPG